MQKIKVLNNIILIQCLLLQYLLQYLLQFYFSSIFKTYRIEYVHCIYNYNILLKFILTKYSEIFT